MLDKNSSLWQYLSFNQRDLLEDGEFLFKDAQTVAKDIHDYSYLVFPYAKAYEGFLKKLFFDLGFMDEHTYRGNHFRIGKALNPSLEPRLRHESMYDKLVGYCGNRQLANDLWATWKKGRNLIFHYFPHNFHKLNFSQAEIIRDEIVSVMASALTACNVRSREE